MSTYGHMVQICQASKFKAQLHLWFGPTANMHYKPELVLQISPMTQAPSKEQRQHCLEGAPATLRAAAAVLEVRLAARRPAPPAQVVSTANKL